MYETSDMKIRRIEPAIQYTSDGTSFDSNANLNGKFINTIILLKYRIRAHTPNIIHTHRSSQLTKRPN